MVRIDNDFIGYILPWVINNENLDQLYVTVINCLLYLKVLKFVLCTAF